MNSVSYNPQAAQSIFGLFHFSAVGDNNLLAGLAAGRSNSLDGFHDVHTIDNAAEYDMLAIEPSGFGSAKEELRAIAENNMMKPQDERQQVSIHENVHNFTNESLPVSATR